MSEKKRRDITLGEMQDECKRRDSVCSKGAGEACCFYEICESMHGIQGDYQDPMQWELTDPPRFSDEAMALFKAFMAIGATHVQQLEWTTFYKRDMEAMPLERFESVGSIFEKSPSTMFRGFEPTKIYDLAELLGKDA